MDAGDTLEQTAIEISSEASANLKQKGTNVEVKADVSLKAEGSANAEFSSSGVTVLKGSIVQIN
jgi:hypothetical protein